MGARSTRSLSPGQGDSSLGGYVVGILNVPVGNYYLKECADYLNVIQEVDETNNCTLGKQISVY